MKCFLKFLCPIVALFLLQSCIKDRDQSELIIDPFTYGSRFDWVEDSIKIDKEDWTKIEKGSVFTWLVDDSILINAIKTSKGFATYYDRSNLKTDFIYSNIEDEVFSFTLSSDSIYFLDRNGEFREDVYGQINVLSDTSLILHNTGSEPYISIKYKLEEIK